MNKGLAMPRKFGIELEGYVAPSVPYGSVDIEGKMWNVEWDGSLRHCRVSCNTCRGRGYFVNNQDNFDRRCETCNGDGSVYDTEKPIELKSGVLENTLQIYEAYRFLQENEWHIDNQAGLHIHVDVTDIPYHKFQNVLALMVGIEPYIYAVTDQFRFTRTRYCKRLDHFADNVITVLNRNAREWPQRLSTVTFASDRYTGLNFKSRERQYTIEFRHFYPQENPEMVEAYVELVTSIVNFACHAELEQIIPITKKLLHTETAEEAGEIIRETLGLVCDLEANNETWVSYPRADFIDFFDNYASHVAPAQAIAFRMPRRTTGGFEWIV